MTIPSPSAQPLATDVLVVGAGAAGMMAGIAAAQPGKRVMLVDGARSLGAKILVAGGGRCNVTHHHVSEADFHGASPRAIRRVLLRFGVRETIDFFASRGVHLKREDTGKLFPVTDRARDVLDALLHSLHRSGSVLLHPMRVEAIAREANGFLATARPGGGDLVGIRAHRVILSTGGQALPKSGSDGHGYQLARSLGHSLTPRITPALVPLILAEGHPLRALSGLAAPARLELRSHTGALLKAVDGPVLCTHFGLSGPAVLDLSRHWLAARVESPGSRVWIAWWTGEQPADLDARFQKGGQTTCASVLRASLPERLASTLCGLAGVSPSSPISSLSRTSRKELVRVTTALELPLTGDRGFTHAEATAGGVPLDEVRLETLRSRKCEGLALCGEILDVDGRIGGFNFQWAWASGHLAGLSIHD